MSEDVHALLGPYIVGAVSDEECADFEAHLATCSSCTEDVANLLEVTAVLGEAEAVAPPLSLRARVMDEIAVTAQVTPTATPIAATATVAPADATVTALADHPRRRRFTLIGVAAASLLVLAGVGIGIGSAVQDRQQQLAFEKDVMMVTSAPDAHAMDLELGSAHLVMSERMDAVVVMGDDAPMPHDGMEYQLWLVMDDGKAMPGPTFMPDDGSFMAMMHAGFDGVVAFAITEEPHGGSEAPTSDPIAVTEI